VKQVGSIPPIELKVADLQQLFNTIDPSPFHERDLDADAEEYIVASAEERPKDSTLRLVIHMTKPDPKLPEPGEVVAKSLKHYFEYRAEVTLRQLKQLLRQGRASLVIGLAFLAACNAAASLFAPGSGTWHGILREGLSILGWVAMWHPLEILLYRWWPLLQLARLFRRLADADVTVEIAAQA
jgi:hypothetical protein